MNRIVHLGFGNFHRAHQAWYTQRANEMTGSAWRITGVSMASRHLSEALAESNGAYTLAMRTDTGLEPCRIALHDDILVARDAPEAVIAAIAAPDTQIVTLTITEKGYALAADGQTGAFELLAQGLARRAERSLPLTVLSCDNLSDNGAVTADLLRRASQGLGLDLDSFLDRHVACPNSTVDRITPKVTNAMRADIAAVTGQAEPAPVMTETFTEWVIEDHFTTPRPAWEVAGALFVPDVAPYETRKLLFLNASHSYLAYAGLLKGHVYVYDAIRDPDLLNAVRALWAEATPALPSALRADLPAYLDALVDRYSVRSMKHRLDQIACDGSLKLQQRIVPILAANTDSEAALEAVATWIAYLIRTAPLGNMAPDPTADTWVGKLTEANIPGSAAQACTAIGLSLTKPQRQRLHAGISAWLTN